MSISMKTKRTHILTLLAAAGLSGMTGCTLLVPTYEPLPEENLAEELPNEYQAEFAPAVDSLDEVSAEQAVASVQQAVEQAQPADPQDVLPSFEEFEELPVQVAEPLIEEPNPFAQMEQEAEVTASAQMPLEENPVATADFEVEEGASSRVVPASFTPEPTVNPAAPNGIPSGATNFHHPEPRLPTPQNPASDPAELTVALTPTAQTHPDEYIFDGGDRNYPVHYQGGEMHGIETEDTVAEFEDDDGKRQVQPTNRVAIYAPRFGSVETVSGIQTDVKLDKPVGGSNTTTTNALAEVRSPVTNTRDTLAAGVGSRSSANAVETTLTPQASRRTDGIIQTQSRSRGQEAQTSVSPGNLETTALQQLNIHIREPSTASARLAPGKEASTSQATQTYSTYRAAATLGREVGGRKGKLHITKEASSLVAKAGDVITFTIRFANTGDYNVSRIRIVDNLTGRLEYVDGTADIEAGGNLGGDLTVEQNKAGGEKLTFTLNQPLQGGQSGTITFRAQVR